MYAENRDMQENLMLNLSFSDKLTPLISKYPKPQESWHRCFYSFGMKSSSGNFLQQHFL